MLALLLPVEIGVEVFAVLREETVMANVGFVIPWDGEGC